MREKGFSIIVCGRLPAVGGHAWHAQEHVPCSNVEVVRGSSAARPRADWSAGGLRRASYYNQLPAFRNRRSTPARQLGHLLRLMTEFATRPQQAQQEDAEEVEEFDQVEKLQQLGINSGDIKKLKEAGYNTCQSLLMNTKKRLTETKGLSEAKVEKALEAAKKMCANYGWQSATQIGVQRQREVMRISCGSSSVDEILGGGFETKCITEMFGEYRTGKTQICHTLCVTSQLPTSMGGAEGKVAYIDTEGTFRPERIAPIAARYNLDLPSVLDNIISARVHTHEQQADVLITLAAKMSEEHFKLVIMDSVMCHLRVDFSGRGELAERQQKLGLLMSRLRKIADEFNAAIVITNQVMSDPSGGAMFVADPKKALGGHVIAHASTVRLSLRKGKAEQRLIKVVDAPNLAEAEASFQISPEGIVDHKD